MVGPRQVDHGDGAQTEVAPDPIFHHAVTGHRRRHLVQERIVQRPPTGVRQRHLQVRRRAPSGDAHRLLRLPRPIGEGEAHREVARRRLAQSHIDTDAGEISTRCEVHRFQRSAATRLEVHRLPHPARLSVPLLPLELERMRRVVHAHGQSVRPRGTCGAGHLEREWRVATLMRADRHTVDPRRGAPVGGAEHHEDASPAPRGRDVDGARVPPDVGAVGNARQWGAPRERHEYLATSGEVGFHPARALTDVRRIEGKAPSPVEV